MLNIKQRYEKTWDVALKPAGYGDHDVEKFEPWWVRNQSSLKNLHPEIAEQWVFRHWHYSPFAFLPLNGLAWRREVWPTNDVLVRIHLEFGGPMDPEHDYNMMKMAPMGLSSTARNWINGSWTIPIVALETLAGVHCYCGDLQDVRFVLVEGSKRLRYLNALHFRGEATGPHSVYVLGSQ